MSQSAVNSIELSNTFGGGERGHETADKVIVPDDDDDDDGVDDRILPFRRHSKRSMKF